MKIILDLDGWRKIEEIPNYIVDTGKVEIVLFPPISALMATRDVLKNNPINVMFVYQGKKKNGLPVFYCWRD